jgi:arabinose-5-phosphate isomerase
MDFCKLGLSVIELEAQAVLKLQSCINAQFNEACALLLACKGRVVVTGMGKSGHIGKKIAATFSSTGTPAFFMHPGEASHGDLGMITRQDVVLALSNSGSTQELIALLPLLKRLEIPLITITGNPLSLIAKTATINLAMPPHEEACPLGLAPTTSTTLSLVLGDALAIALLQARGFTAEDFARSHPGGMLGKRLLLRIDDIAHQGDELPIVSETASIREALLEVNAKKLGMTCVVDSAGLLAGIYTDGDIRRTLTEHHDMNTTPLSSVITRKCHTVSKGLLAAEALALMQKHSITSLVMIDAHFKPEGVIHLHDLLKAGVY